MLFARAKILAQEHLAGHILLDWGGDVLVDVNAQIKILVRVDAGTTIGTGHLMRCIAVAEQLQTRACEVIFLCREVPNDLVSMIRSSGFGLRLLHDQGDDVKNTIAVVHESDASCLIVDGYHLSDEYVNRANKMGVLTVRFDDLTDGEHCSAHIVINGSHTAEYARYHDWAPHAKLLLGPKYFPFRKEFADKFAADSARATHESRSIFLNFGGSDPLGLSCPVALGLHKAIPDALINVVTGAGYSNPQKLDEIVNINIRHYHNVFQISDIMVGSYLAISAGGGTIAELELFRVPTILVVTADNQVAAAQQSHCHVIDYSPLRDEMVQAIIKAASNLWSDESLYQQLKSKIGHELDARGATRIAEEILSHKMLNAD